MTANIKPTILRFSNEDLPLLTITNESPLMSDEKSSSFEPSHRDIQKAILLKAELLNCCFFQPAKCFSTGIHYPRINISIFSLV